MVNPDMLWRQKLSAEVLVTQHSRVSWLGFSGASLAIGLLFLAATATAKNSIEISALLERTGVSSNTPYIDVAITNSSNLCYNGQYTIESDIGSTRRRSGAFFSSDPRDQCKDSHQWTR